MCLVAKSVFLVSVSWASLFFLILIFSTSFWVNDHLYFGVDHLHFVERALGNTSAAPPRFHPAPAQPRKAKLTIYHDFSSPWSYIGSTQVGNLYVCFKAMCIAVFEKEKYLQVMTES